LCLYNPKVTIPGNADEQRYFHLFSQTTATELRGYFDSIFWAQTVLQESLNEPAIRHAVTAIAALSRVAEEEPKTSRPMGIRKIKDGHYRFGIEQYNKAVVSLRERLARKENALRTALIACILFVCVEAMQGDQASASSQIHGGLNIMQQVHRSRLQIVERCKQPVIEDEIVQLYANIHVQSFFLVFTKIPHHLPVSLPPHMQERYRHIFSNSMPRIFTSVSEAKRALDLALNSIVQLFSSCTSSAESRVDKYAQHHARLQQWDSAFQPLLIKAKASTVNLNLEAKTAPLVLSIYHRVAIIVLTGAVRRDETAYDSLRKEFSYIVSTCRSVLDALAGPSTSTASSPRPRFSFDVGIVPPLYIVGTKCREPAPRRQAIELLRRCPVQEGLWEPIGASRICEWIMGIEEMGLAREGLDDEGGEAPVVRFVPEGNRVRLTGMQCELSKRRIWVKCKGVVPVTEDGLVKVWENVIRW